MVSLCEIWNSRENNRVSLKILAIKEILHDEELKKLPIYVFKSEGKSLDGKKVDLTNELNQISASKQSFDVTQITAKDKLFYIYTSGTTGLPKAAVITNLR